MSKQDIRQDLDQILGIISKDDSGISLNNIIDRLDPPLSRRTLQRRLQQLKDKNFIYTEGRGRSTQYFARQTDKAIIDLTAEGYIKLSHEGNAVRNQISKPIKKRKTVSYNREFLFSYTPNQSYYLNPEIRHHLHKIGKENNGEQPAGTFAKKIMDRLLIDLSWNSSRLEGNTYSLLDTERLIHQGKEAEGKNLFETRMILNHKAAIEFLLEQDDGLDFNRYIILNLHALLSRNLLGDPAASGRLRTIQVGIGKTVYQPVAIPQLIIEYFQKILNTAKLIDNPFEQSFFSMVHLPYLQPFVDVNKRVSRLAANIPLIKHNLCPISFIDVPKQAYIDGILGVYELNNIDLLIDVYVWTYERSTLRYSEARSFFGEPEPFLERYDTKIRNLIKKIILDKLNKDEASKTIISWSKKHISTNDQDRFIEAVQTQLLAVHEGNIANYAVKPAEFMTWRDIWNQSR